MDNIDGAADYQKPASVVLTEDKFGTFIDPDTGKKTDVRRFTWKNSNHISVQVITYGATITSIKLPSFNGTIDDIVLGFDNLEGYLGADNPFFGASIGRNANRIGNARFTIDGVTYNVSANDGNNQLHGGFRGFDKRLWQHHKTGNKVTLSYCSQDTEEGFPGAVVANATFELTVDNEFLVEYIATTTKPTLVNMTNHSYFNLAGNNKGPAELMKHVVSVNGDLITEVNSQGIPSGKLLPVGDTVFDLRIPKVVGNVIRKVPGGKGYDHNYCLSGEAHPWKVFAGRASHPGTRRILEVYTNQPGVQFYTAGNIPDAGVVGKGGYPYAKYGALCFEPQNWPDAINHANFPAAVLNPGKVYRHSFSYKFYVN